MRSSTTPPVASSQHSVYCACPGAIRARSLVSVALTKSRAPRPRTTPLPRWLTSKIPTACRTAACSLSTPPSGYSIGISQPPKSAILAPRPTWRSYSGEWYSGGPAAAAAAAAEAIMRTDASASPATSAGDKRHCIDVAPGRLAGPCPCWSLPVLVLALAGPCVGRFTRVVRHGLRPKSTLPSTSASPLPGRYLRNASLSFWPAPLRLPATRSRWPWDCVDSLPVAPPSRSLPLPVSSCSLFRALSSVLMVGSFPLGWFCSAGGLGHAALPADRQA